MCDQTEVSYLEDDVVWVKIGPIWWPGVVKDLEKDDEGKEILAGLKKKPIAVVKFFQEDNYEFVKNLDCIYHYSCRRKDEFIKKGLDKFRTGASHMKKFPADVTTAESLTNGDVNIINDPKFLPEKKESYSEIFGSGKKKAKKETELTPRSKVRSSAGVTPYRPITHQRFINKVLHGESDHRVKNLIQTNSSSEESASRNPYKCHICKFETSRVNVIVAHHRLSHSSKNSINWTGCEGKSMRKKPAYKSRKLKGKKLFETSLDGFAEVDDSEARTKSKKDKARSAEKGKPGGSSSSPSKRKNKEDSLSPSDGGSTDSKKPRFTDVLLADWNEDEEEERDKKEVEDEGPDSKSAGGPAVEDGEIKSENASSSVDSLGGQSDSPDPSKRRTEEKKSCFDFDEEEEGFIGMSNANTYGRKIPRVIPVKDKPELGMDLEIDDLFKKKTDSESETEKDGGDGEERGERANDARPVEETEAVVEEEEKKVEDEKAIPPPPGNAKRRRGKAGKEDGKASKIDPEKSLSLRRTRRPGAKKSYLNEVIEKIEEEPEDKEVEEEEEQQQQQEKETKGKKETVEKKELVESIPEEVASESVKVESSSSSSSRRKQDFKNQTIDSEREEMVYSDIVNSEQKRKPGEGGEKKRGKSQIPRRETKEDLAARIEDLLEETKPAVISKSPDGKAEESKSSSSTTNFSFDYLPGEQQPGKKPKKSRAEVKSISRMFGDSIPNPETDSDGDSQGAVHPARESQEEMATPSDSSGQNKSVHQMGNISLKGGSIVLSGLPKPSAADSSAKSIPVSARPKDCLVMPPGRKDAEESPEAEPETSDLLANVKTIKLKPDSLSSSLIGTRKLKGQTIIHQKSGNYVIVTQPPQLGRQRVASEKVQSGGKVVILTNQHGEKKIITTGGLQQAKFKVDGGQNSSLAEEKDAMSSSSSSSSAGSASHSPAQPVIKMVPDGKGGIMKQLTVSPKKVLLGGTTKVYVSGSSGSSFPAGNNVQKIAFATSGSRAGGVGGVGVGGGVVDYRLIENYKGSGKMVLIQGGSGPGGSGVVLKPSSVVPRQVAKVMQSPQSSSVKKKPKILMRASAGQGVSEYVVQSSGGTTIESPAYVVKSKGTDGKFSAQKIVKTEFLNQGKAIPSGGGTTGPKRFFLSGQGSSKKGESFIIEGAVPGKVIRMRQKIKEVVDATTPAAAAAATAKATQKTVLTKTPEMYGVTQQNSLLLPQQQQQQQQSSAETESPQQTVQIQEQPRQSPAVLQTQVIAMPGPVSVDGNQTYVLVSVDEHGVVQGMDNSVVAAAAAASYDPSSGQDQIFVNSTSATGNVILLNPQPTEEPAPIFSTSSQDILAEALANTNVLEGSITSEMDPVVPSILLPPSIPSSVVQETSITLQKPIMTPLEMPTSVAPDTSCLEPPPLPPTPTNEDVLMGEEEDDDGTRGTVADGEGSAGTARGSITQEQLIQHEKREGEMSSSDAVQTFLRPQSYAGADGEASPPFRSAEPETGRIFQDGFDEAEKNDGEKEEEEEDEEDRKGFLRESQLQAAGVAAEEEEEEEEAGDDPKDSSGPPRGDSEERQTGNSLQSMPILNSDEPDTSDDAAGSEPIADQQFESQKLRMEADELSRLLLLRRDQEPPTSSTADEFNGREDSRETQEEFGDGFKRERRDREENVAGEENVEGDGRGEEEMEKDGAEGEGEVEEKKESHSMPVISEDGGNGFEIRDPELRKRFQEETEVSSTTADEYAGKEVASN